MDISSGINDNTLKFSSNFEYRNYMTKNGNSIVKNTNKINLYNQQCICNYAHVENIPLANNSPFLYKNNFQTDMPYGYTESDLKNNFIDNRRYNYASNSIKVVNPMQYLYNIQIVNNQNTNNKTTNNESTNNGNNSTY